MTVTGSRAVVHAQGVLLRDAVFEQLQEAILDGSLKPGQVLRGIEMETWLGVSRTPIREAINHLVQIGLVELQANRYTRVAVPRVAEAAVAAQALGVVALGVLRLTVGRLGPDQEETAGVILQGVRSALADRRLLLARNRSSAFWITLAEFAGNKSLQRMLEMSIVDATFRLTPKILARNIDVREMGTWFGELEVAVDSSDLRAAESAAEKIYRIPDSRGVSDGRAPS